MSGAPFAMSATRRSLVETLAGFGAPDVFPSADSMTRSLPSLCGVLRVSSPASSVRLKRFGLPCRRPARLRLPLGAPFPISPPDLRSDGPGDDSRRPGARCPGPLPGRSVRSGRASQVPVASLALAPRSQTSADLCVRLTLDALDASVLPYACLTASAPAIRLSGLNRAARSLPVHASRPGSLRGSRKTRFRLLARLAGRGLHPLGCLRMVSERHVMLFLLALAYPGAPDGSSPRA